MKTNKSILIAAFAALLGLLLIGTADAGAVFRHDGGDNGDQSTVQSRSDDRSSDSKDSRSDSSNTTRSSSDNSRSTQDRSSSDRSSSDRGGSSDQSSDNGSQYTRTNDRGSSTQSTATDRGKSKDQSGDNRSSDRNNSTQTTTTPTVHPDRHIGSSCRAKIPPAGFCQNNCPRQELERQQQPQQPRHQQVHARPGRTTFRAPKRSNGHYRYDYGWVNTYNFDCNYGFWVFTDTYGDSLRSVYYYYDYFPFVPRAHVIVLSRPRVVYVETPIVVSSYDDGYYYLNRNSNGINEALTDIRLAWTQQDANLFLRHVRSSTKVDVLIDGAYSYTVDGSDYSAMTQDAIGAINTIDFRFDTVRKRGDGRIVAYGTHEFYSGYGDRKTTYVSYVLERQGTQWVIVEAGSSGTRLDR